MKKNIKLLKIYSFINFKSCWNCIPEGKITFYATLFCIPWFKSFCIWMLQKSKFWPEYCICKYGILFWVQKKTGLLIINCKHVCVLTKVRFSKIQDFQTTFWDYILWSTIFKAKQHFCATFLKVNKKCQSTFFFG